MVAIEEINENPVMASPSAMAASQFSIHIYTRIRRACADACDALVDEKPLDS